CVGFRGSLRGHHTERKALMTRLEIMADYFQIYACDPAHNEDWSALLTAQSVDDRIVALPHTVVFGTGRNMPVSVDIVVHEQQPDLTALIAPSDHAVVGGVVCGSGQLKVLRCTTICRMRLLFRPHRDLMALHFSPSI